MRVAEICPSCATYINASCIVYNGDYLPALEAEPLMTLDEILGLVNDTFTISEGASVPSFVPKYKGQFYVDASGILYIGMGTTTANWGVIGSIATTTTTTSTSSTTTTTTTAP